jgi:hypothetical protein
VFDQIARDKQSEIAEDPPQLTCCRVRGTSRRAVRLAPRPAMAMMATEAMTPAQDATEMQCAPCDDMAVDCATTYARPALGNVCSNAGDSSCDPTVCQFICVSGNTFHCQRHVGALHVCDSRCRFR